MTRLAMVIVLTVIALPCAASAPCTATKTKATPRVVLPNPPPNVPMQIPPTIREPMLSSDVLDTFLASARTLVEQLLDRAGLTPAHFRMKRLLNQSTDL
jgi:hypothetical protein